MTGKFIPSPYSYTWIRTGEYRYINIGSSNIRALQLNPSHDYWELQTEIIGFFTEPIDPNQFLEVLRSIDFENYYDAPSHHGNKVNYEIFAKKNT